MNYRYAICVTVAFVLGALLVVGCTSKDEAVENYKGPGPANPAKPGAPAAGVQTGGGPPPGKMAPPVAPNAGGVGPMAAPK